MKNGIPTRLQTSIWQRVQTGLIHRPLTETIKKNNDETAFQNMKNRKPPRFTPAFRELHRAEIKESVKHWVDQKWESLYGALSAGLMFFGFGLRAALDDSDPGARIFLAAIAFLASAIFLALYRFSSHSLARTEGVPEALKRREIAVQAVLIVMPLACINNVEIAACVAAAATTYSARILYKNARPYWKIWFFRAARGHFRGLQNQRSIPVRDAAKQR